ncbi:hypothetical protein ACQ4PT_030500 [Festuca glaucescens]
MDHYRCTDDGSRGLVGEEERVEHWVMHLPPMTHSDTTYDVTFDWDFYVPRDECFNHVKKADFTSYLLKAISAGILPLARELFDTAVPREFDDFRTCTSSTRVGSGSRRPRHGPHVQSLPAAQEHLPIGGSYLLKMPMPEVIKNDKLAWRTDEEFAREMLAGLNPHIITRLKEFPPRSKLDGYGDQTSNIKWSTSSPTSASSPSTRRSPTAGSSSWTTTTTSYLQLLKINSLENTFVYATRTLLILQDDDTLKPIAIELSRPRLDEIGTKVVGADSKVYTPPPLQARSRTITSRTPSGSWPRPTPL